MYINVPSFLKRDEENYEMKMKKFIKVQLGSYAACYIKRQYYSYL